MIIILAILSLFFTFGRELHAGIVERESDYYIEDEIVGHIHRPYARREYNSPEYRKGKIVLKTNNLGFREDTDTKVNKTEGVIRILVTGDSHIDGVVNNNESFSYVLENKLNSVNQTTKFEILNGGVGYYGFDHYPLFLYKYLFLKPDIYIVVIYTGNDFLDAAKILELKGEFNQRPAKYIKSLQNCMWAEGAMNQVMNQIYYFRTFPIMKEKTVKYTLEIISRISDFCKLHNINFIVVFLPTKADVEWQSDGDSLEKAKECLGLDESDLRINRELTEALIKGISKNNINFLDLYHDMRNQNTEFYWRKDYHLNDQGHKFVAEKMYEKYYNFFIRCRMSTKKNLPTVICKE